jgi:alanine racemase
MIQANKVAASLFFIRKADAAPDPLVTSGERGQIPARSPMPLPPTDSESYPLSPPRAWAEVDLYALAHNVGVAVRAGGHPIMAVLKAGAYGHGLEEVARALAGHPDVAFYGVANVGEARRIARAGVRKPIYLLGATWAGEREEIVARGWVPCLSTLEEAAHFDRLAEAAGKNLVVHVAVDTGMGRGGFVAAELPARMQELEAFPNLHLDGIGSHLPSADEDREFTLSQIACFERVVAATGGADRWRWRHLFNSAGLLGYHCQATNLTRPGLMLYGHAPIEAAAKAELRTVMTLKARVSLIRELPAGHGVSYGRTFITTRPTRVATLGIGYGDGYPRHLSGQGAEVLLGGKRVPVLGRVTMDQIMVDATGLAISEGDEAEIFGPNVELESLAAKAGTIAWEILTRVTARVARVHRGGD